jgi:hypothetical protein
VITGKRLVEVDDPDPVFERLMSGSAGSGSTTSG